MLSCSRAPVPTPMGMVWGVMETGGVFCFFMLVSLCQCCGYLRNADSPVSADHGTLQEMTITTEAKYDSKCHGVPLSCGWVTASDHVNLVSPSWLPDLLCLFKGTSQQRVWSLLHKHALCLWFGSNIQAIWSLKTSAMLVILTREQGTSSFVTSLRIKVKIMSHFQT